MVSKQAPAAPSYREELRREIGLLLTTGLLAESLQVISIIGAAMWLGLGFEALLMAGLVLLNIAQLRAGRNIAERGVDGLSKPCRRARRPTRRLWVRNRRQTGRYHQFVAQGAALGPAVKKTISLPLALAKDAEKTALAEGKSFSRVVQDALRLASTNRGQEKLRALQDRREPAGE